LQLGTTLGLLLIAVGANCLAAPTLPTPGVDGYEQMMEVLGKPQRTETTINGHNYHYDGFSVNISSPDPSTINTIVFLKPLIFKKYPEVDVRMNVEDLMPLLKDYYHHRDKNHEFIADYDRWLIYWIDHGRVIKLVHARPNGFKRMPSTR
jgi:hypothetical protein